jgi:hypothetical protein
LYSVVKHRQAARVKHLDTPAARMCVHLCNDQANVQRQRASSISARSRKRSRYS